MSNEYEPCRILDQTELDKPQLDWRVDTERTRIQKLFNMPSTKKEFPEAFQRHTHDTKSSPFTTSKKFPPIKPNYISTMPLSIVAQPPAGALISSVRTMFSKE
ncbi:hypothetical protein EBR66_04950 [bacterium]|nr:hypothetical protein [bacterium]